MLACVAAALAVVASGCDRATVSVPKSQSRLHRGAELFAERCSGCHTLDAAGALGSKPEGQAAAGERTNGPNFNVRRENRDDVLFAIRNGGFSGAIMPANVLVGRDADDVALFVERYAGRKSPVQGRAGEKTPGGGK